ncbi:MAG: zinc transporter ZntB, partial [Pseudomonadota bacterium]
VSYRWVHLDLAEEGVRAWIETNVDKTVSQSLTLEDTRPRCTDHCDGLLLNLRGVNLNPDSDPEDMVAIRMWIEKGMIVSVRLRRLMAIVAIRDEMENGQGPKNVGAFITKLSAALTERMDPVISGLADKIDELEEVMLDAPHGIRTDLADTRRKTIMLRRYIGPQRDALNRLGSETHDLLDLAQKTAVREVVDRITRMVEEMDTVRERSAILYDQISDQRAEEMNRNMLILSVVAAIFLPLGFLTGLLGVNIGGIPGSSYEGSFVIFCVALIIMTFALVWWFKKKKWI